MKKAETIEVHHWDCECEFCVTPLGDLVAKYGFPCDTCGHKHAGKTANYRCFNCACAEVPAWESGKAVAAVDPHVGGTTE